MRLPHAVRSKTKTFIKRAQMMARMGHKERKGAMMAEDGPQRKKRCYERLTSQQSDILDRYFPQSIYCL
jgi:hypothetical protein